LKTISVGDLNRRNTRQPGQTQCLSMLAFG